MGRSKGQLGAQFPSRAAFCVAYFGAAPKPQAIELVCFLNQVAKSLTHSTPTPPCPFRQVFDNSQQNVLIIFYYFSLFADALPQSQSQQPPPLPSPSLTPSLASPSQQQQQAPRFITHPSSSGSIVSEGRTKILQCHALGKSKPTIS